MIIKTRVPYNSVNLEILYKKVNLNNSKLKKIINFINENQFLLPKLMYKN